MSENRGACEEYTKANGSDNEGWAYIYFRKNKQVTHPHWLYTFVLYKISYFINKGESYRLCLRSIWSFVSSVIEAASKKWCSSRWVCSSLVCAFSVSRLDAFGDTGNVGKIDFKGRDEFVFITFYLMQESSNGYSGTDLREGFFPYSWEFVMVKYPRPSKTQVNLSLYEMKFSTPKVRAVETVSGISCRNETSWCRRVRP